MNESSEPTAPPISALVDDNTRLLHSVGERVKELTALHQTARVLQDDSRPPEALIADVLLLLPPAWQYPEITEARVYFQGISVRSSGFKPTEWMQSASFTTREGETGGIDVCYLEERPPAVEGPFLAEERDLINSLAEMLRSYFQRAGALRALEEAKSELEAQVQLRTRQLEEANESLRQQVVEYRRAQERIEGYQQKLRRLASELSLSEARHRRAIAGELHDHIGQALAFIRLGVLRFKGDAVFCGFEESISRILRLVEEAIHSTRSLTFQISPPVLYELGLVPAFEWLAEEFERKHGLKVSVEADRGVDQVPDDTRAVLFHAVQELLVNTVKHAEASRAGIRAHRHGGEITVCVSDDGRGFDVGQADTESWDRMTFGLFSIRERLEVLGGNMTLESHPGSGTAISLTIPIFTAPAEADG